VELWFSERMNFPEIIGFPSIGFEWKKYVDVKIEGIAFTYDVVYLSDRILGVKMIFQEHVDAKFVEIRFNNESIFSNYDDNFPLESRLVTIQLKDFTFYTNLELNVMLFCNFLTYLTVALGGIFFVNLFIGSSLVKVWNYFMYLQILNSLIYLNFNLPRNMVEYFGALDFMNLGFAQGFWEGVMRKFDYEAGFYSSTYYKFFD